MTIYFSGGENAATGTDIGSNASSAGSSEVKENNATTETGEKIKSQAPILLIEDQKQSIHQPVKLQVQSQGVKLQGQAVVQKIQLQNQIKN